ncbi:hypothetical protein FRB99_005321 [Tulasnella sp. 403]|nr:hypothetical protein FRB99_005321 [Tulasnella sp. 403]
MASATSLQDTPDVISAMSVLSLREGEDAAPTKFAKARRPLAPRNGLEPPNRLNEPITPRNKIPRNSPPWAPKKNTKAFTAASTEPRQRRLLGDMKSERYKDAYESAKMRRRFDNDLAAYELVKSSLADLYKYELQLERRKLRTQQQEMEDRFSLLNFVNQPDDPHLYSFSGVARA